MFEGPFSNSREGAVVTLQYCSAIWGGHGGPLPMQVRLNHPFGFERFQLYEFMTRVSRQNAL